jgi:hypothetical protein
VPVDSRERAGLPLDASKAVVLQDASAAAGWMEMFVKRNTFGVLSVDSQVPGFDIRLFEIGRIRSWHGRIQCEAEDILALRQRATGFSLG